MRTAFKKSFGVIVMITLMLISGFNEVPKPIQFGVITGSDEILSKGKPENLEWVTVSENRLHAYQVGLNTSGERHHWATLTASQVDEIRKIGKSMSQQKIADIFGVSQTCIGKILNNKHWKQCP